MMAATPLLQSTGNSGQSKYYLNPQGGPSPPPEAYLYGKNGFTTPMAQTPPSNNVSPTNLHSSAHKLNVQYRQVRPQRQPLYVPAALRPTETRPADIPRPQNIATPPTSNENSFDSTKSSPSNTLLATSPTTRNSLDVDEQMAVLRRGLSRAASDDLDEELGEVTGEPTTAHWKPDASNSQCALCQQEFTWYFRRHHCRRCGDVVCDSHSRFRVPLDQNARYHPAGLPSRACDHCAQEYRIIKKLRRHRNNSIGGDSMLSTAGGSSNTLPIPGGDKRKDGDDPMWVGSMARSEGMTWSTF